MRIYSLSPATPPMNPSKGRKKMDDYIQIFIKKLLDAGCSLFLPIEGALFLIEIVKMENLRNVFLYHVQPAKFQTKTNFHNRTENKGNPMIRI